MCTNFTPTKNNSWVQDNFGVDLPQTYPSDVYPGFSAPIVVKSHQSGRVACGAARFGLIPAWAKDEKISRHTYNARSETAENKPSYRAAWRKQQFGLVLVDHFYEPNYETGKSIPWKISLESEEPFAIACLWDRWTNSTTGEIVVSFSMLTVNADEHPIMRQFHRVGDEKRTPVIISKELHHVFLSASPFKSHELMNWAHMPKLRSMPSPKIVKSSIAHSF